MNNPILFILFLFFCSHQETKKQPSSDPNFLTVTIGGNTWTAEDVHTPLPGAKCLDTTCQQVLYTWKEAQQLDEQLPGWRLPTRKDWRKLEVHFGSGLMEEFAAVTVGKEVKAALQIKMLSGVFSIDGQDNIFWVKPINDVVQMDGSRQIMVKHFYSSSAAEKTDQIWTFITDAENDACFSVRLIKEE